MVDRELRLSGRSLRAVRNFAPFGGREGFVRLDRNEDPVGWPEDLVNEFAQSISPEALAAYPDPSQLQESIARWLDRGVKEILITSGSSEGLRLVFETFADERSSTVLLDPSYSLYDLYRSVAGSKSVTAQYSKGLAPPLDELLESISAARPSLVVLANPNQPLGVDFSLKDLRGIAQAANCVGAVLAIDEAYHLFGAETALALLDEFPNVVLVRTFSKAFGLAGLRLGYLVGQPSIIAQLRKLEPAVPPSSISLLGGTWALSHLDVALDRVAAAVQGRGLLAANLEKVGSPALPSLGNFLLVPCGSEQAAVNIVAGARQLGFLIKGPLLVRHIGPCVRVTIGPPELMERFWSNCQYLFSQPSDLLN